MSSDKRKNDSLDRLRFQRMNPDELKKRFPFKHFLSDNSVFRYRFDSICSAIFASSPTSPTNVTKSTASKKSLSEAFSSAISRHSSKRKLISNDIHSGANHSLDTNQIGRSVDSLFTSSPVNCQKSFVGNSHRYFKKLRSISDSEKKISTKALLLSRRKTGCHSTLSSPKTIAPTRITSKNAPFIRTTNSFAYRHLKNLKSGKYNNVQQESTKSRKDNEPIFIYTLRKPSKAHIIDANITKSDYFYKFFGDYVPRLSEENECEEECADEEANKKTEELEEARQNSTNSNERYGKQIRARVKHNLRISKKFQKKLLNNQLIELNSNKMGQKYSNYHSITNMNHSSSQSHNKNIHHYRYEHHNENNTHSLHRHHHREQTDRQQHISNNSINNSHRYRQNHQLEYHQVRRSLDDELRESDQTNESDNCWSDKRLKCFQYNYTDNYKTKSLVIEDGDDGELDEIFSSYRRVSASMGSLEKEKTSSELTLLDMKLMEEKYTPLPSDEIIQRSTKHTDRGEQLNNIFNYSSNPISYSPDNKEPLHNNVSMATSNNYVDQSNLSIPSFENRSRQRIDIIPPHSNKLSMTLGQSSLSIERRTNSECSTLMCDKQEQIGDLKMELRKRKMPKQNFWRMSMNKNINSIDYHLKEEENMHEFGTKSTPISPKNFERKDIEGEFKFKTYSTNINSRIGSSNALMSTTNFCSIENDKINSTISNFPNSHKLVSISIPSSFRSKSTTITTAPISNMTSMKTPPPTTINTTTITTNTNTINNNNNNNNNSSTISSTTTLNSITGNRLNRFKQTFAQKRFSFMKTYSNRLSDTSIDSITGNDENIVSNSIQTQQESLMKKTTTTAPTANTSNSSQSTRMSSGHFASPRNGKKRNTESNLSCGRSSFQAAASSFHNQHHHFTHQQPQHQIQNLPQQLQQQSQQISQQSNSQQIIQQSSYQQQNLINAFHPSSLIDSNQLDINNTTTKVNNTYEMVCNHLLHSNCFHYSPIRFIPFKFLSSHHIRVVNSHFMYLT
ncbi:hypothetical protein SNEBB_002381 [Seison nebaliae]|nr:hypothetical protein SNEBB_002381 [Seison nebaliae]